MPNYWNELRGDRHIELIFVTLCKTCFSNSKVVFRLIRIKILLFILTNDHMILKFWYHLRSMLRNVHLKTYSTNSWWKIHNSIIHTINKSLWQFLFHRSFKRLYKRKHFHPTGFLGCEIWYNLRGSRGLHRREFPLGHLVSAIIDLKFVIEGDDR